MNATQDKARSEVKVITRDDGLYEVTLYVDGKQVGPWLSFSKKLKLTSVAMSLDEMDGDKKAVGTVVLSHRKKLQEFQEAFKLQPKGPEEMTETFFANMAGIVERDLGRNQSEKVTMQEAMRDKFVDLYQKQELEKQGILLAKAQSAYIKRQRKILDDMEEKNHTIRALRAHKFEL